MDGWGLSPTWAGNAILMNNPPNISQYWREYPHKVLLSFSQETENQEIIDSKLAYTTIASGRQIEQDERIIDKSIADRSFYHNETLIKAFKFAEKNQSAVHLIGLLSDSNYSRINHLNALLELSFRLNFKRVYLDLITDGISAGPKTGLDFLTKVKRKINEIGLGQITSITGRDFVLTDTQDKILKFTQMLIKGEGDRADTPEWAIQTAYKKGLEDNNIPPTLVRTPEGIVNWQANDVGLFFNFRGARMEKIIQALTVPGSPKFLIVSLTKYTENLNAEIAFPRSLINGTLPEIFAKYQKNNLRIAESVKQEHLTTFFNGGRQQPLAFEERIVIPSQKNRNFAASPEMAGAKITEIAKQAIQSKKYDFLTINFPNPDLVAHTGNILAAGRAVMAVDRFVSQIVQTNLETDGATIIVGDHGIVEQITGSKTHHTTNPVPFIFIAKDKKRDLLKGALSIHYSTLAKLIGLKENLTDVAPTILELMNLPKSEYMTGHSLLNKLD